MPDFHQGFDPMGLVIDWLDACKERRLSSLIDLYDEIATLDWAARARPCADFRMSNATFAVVRPITPTLCPARSLISLIFGASLVLGQVRKSPTAQRSSCARWRRSAHRSASPDRHDRSQDRPWQHRAGQGLRPRLSDGNSER